MTTYLYTILLNIMTRDGSCGNRFRASMPVVQLLVTEEIFRKDLWYWRPVFTTFCGTYPQRSDSVNPPVHCTDIFDYLVLTRSFCTTERFKSIEAYKYFENGSVDLHGSIAFIVYGGVCYSHR